jgi:hypothetical protein
MPEEPKSDEAQSEEPKLQSWWQTVPGLLTAVAALITALTGLAVAVYQIRDSPQVSAPSGSEQASPEKPDAAASQTPSGEGGTQQSLSLPVGMEVKLAGGDIVYKILSARLEHYNAEKDALSFTIRCTSNSPYPVNFWDRSFRLLVDDVPRAPISGLNEVVEGQSAKEGDIVFEVPTGEDKVVLQISAPTASGTDETTEIPFDLTAAKP